MTMPKMSGDKLAREIKAIRGTMPVLLLTGFSEQVQGKTHEDLGVEGVMFKPVIRSKLATAIFDILKKQSEKNV
jgi:CheY-like chemotaxis protein